MVVTLGVIPSGTALPGAGVPLRNRVGFSTATVWMAPREGYRYLQKARDAGVSWVREDFAWSLIQPARGRFAWAWTDALMRNAAQLKIHVLAVAGYAPPWASGHADSDKYPPRDPRDYATFVKAIADRYGPGGRFWRSNPRLPPSPLTAIELWNEPWLVGFWGTGPDPAAYARLVRTATTTVKPSHPRIALLASADVSGSGGSPWIAPLLAADPALWQSRLVDGWTVHLYCQEQSPWDEASQPQFRFDRVLMTRRLTQEARADKPIWITEFGWSSEPGSPDAVSEEVQAQYEHDGLVRATTEWGSFVRRSFVFTLTKPSSGGQYNVIRPDGSERPAWFSIQAFIATGT